jgi:hypothetical protein
MLNRAKPNRRDYALLCLLVDTGCRRGEIALDESDLFDCRDLDALAVNLVDLSKANQLRLR